MNPASLELFCEVDKLRLQLLRVLGEEQPSEDEARP